MEELLARLEERVKLAVTKIDELTADNRRLEAENTVLRTENESLRLEVTAGRAGLDELEELRRRLDDSEARKELAREKLEQIIAELDRILELPAEVRPPESTWPESAAEPVPELLETDETQVIPAPADSSGGNDSPPPLRAFPEDENEQPSLVFPPREYPAAPEPEPSDPADGSPLQEEDDWEPDSRPNPLGLIGSVVTEPSPEDGANGDDEQPH